MATAPDAVYNYGDYYIGTDGKTYYYDGTKWEEWLLGGLPFGGKVSIPPTGLLGVVSGASVPAAGAAINPVAAYALTEPNKYGSLRYPSDADGNSDYMVFEFYEYKPPFSAGNSSVSSDGKNQYAAYNSSVSASNLGKKQLSQIVLYMPEDVSTSYKANWDGKKFSNIGAGLLQTAGNAGAGDMRAALAKLGETAGGAITRAPTQLGSQAISAIIGSITSESISQNDIFSSIGGQILNPNAELIFGGHDFRSFSFTYKLVAFNQLEAQKINDIIRVFKKAMLPSLSGTDTLKGSDLSSGGEYEGSAPQTSDLVTGFIKNPLLVQPYFMHKTGIHRYLPRFKPCVISDFDVNYTADGTYATYVGGQPVATTITVSLQETKLVYREDIGRGF